jgi:hypothetical protein
MNTYKFQVSMSGASVPESATRVINHLVSQGYALKSDGRPREATLERSGSTLSMKDHRGPHELKLQFSDSSVSFDFRVTSLWKDAPSKDAFQTVVDRAKEELVKRCGSCAEYVRADAKLCRFCQKPL